MSKMTATFTLLREVKRDLLKALRSGKYKQIQGTLCKGNGYYCCLGVLSKIAGKTDQEMDGFAFPHQIGIGERLTDEEANALHIEGFNNDAGTWAVFYKGEWTSLTHLNDTEKLTFKQIANIIDKTVKTHR